MIALKIPSLITICSSNVCEVIHVTFSKEVSPQKPEYRLLPLTFFPLLPKCLTLCSYATQAFDYRHIPLVYMTTSEFLMIMFCKQIFHRSCSILEWKATDIGACWCTCWSSWLLVMTRLRSQGTARVPLPFLEYGYSFLRVDQPSTGVWLLSLSQCPEFDVWSKTHALEKTSLQVAE